MRRKINIFSLLLLSILVINIFLTGYLVRIRQLRQSEAQTQVTTYDVFYNEGGFTPQSINLFQGDTVKWTNQSTGYIEIASDPHPIHTDYPQMNLGLIEPGGTSSFTFNDLGTYGYHNHLKEAHAGSVTVQQLPTSTPSPSPTNSPLPTATSIPTQSPSPAITSTPVPTATSTQTPTPSPTKANGIGGNIISSPTPIPTSTLIPTPENSSPTPTKIFLSSTSPTPTPDGFTTGEFIPESKSQGQRIIKIALVLLTVAAPVFIFLLIIYKKRKKQVLKKSTPQKDSKPESSQPFQAYKPWNEERSQKRKG